MQAGFAFFVTRLAEFQDQRLLGLVHRIEAAEHHKANDDDGDARDHETQICHCRAPSERFFSSGSGR